MQFLPVRTQFLFIFADRSVETHSVENFDKVTDSHFYLKRLFPESFWEVYKADSQNWIFHIEMRFLLFAVFSFLQHVP